MTRQEREWRATHLMRRAARKDNNHAAIIATLRGIGAFVVDTSSLGLFVDAVCAFRGVWYVLEFKNRETWYGRAGLNENQRRLADAAGDAPVLLVTTPDEALAAIGAL
jgi:hypothetical protein